MGTGYRPSIIGDAKYTCSVCKGHGIIDEFTGNPPLQPKNNNSDINGGINGIGESQQEYYGKE